MLVKMQQTYTCGSSLGRRETWVIEGTLPRFRENRTVLTSGVIKFHSIKELCGQNEGVAAVNTTSDNKSRHKV